jgi:branched-chain amino acid transport system ATP-binding protein
MPLKEVDQLGISKNRCWDKLPEASNNSVTRQVNSQAVLIFDPISKKTQTCGDVVEENYKAPHYNILSEGGIMLSVKQLEAGYGRLKILNGINLEVNSGKIVAILGGNGTGKTTLLKVISGLIRPFSGSIEYDGHRIDGLRADKIVKMGLIQVPQGKDVFPSMTVKENLEIGAYTRKDHQKVKQDFERIYEYFPRLKERKNQLAGTLSGGELQMLVLGRGLLSKPKLMLLDEPSAALAPQVVMEIFRIINRIHNDGITLLIVEQNVRLALILADFGYIIRDGTIIFKGESENLIKNENVRLSYLGGTVAPNEGNSIFS